MANKETAQSQNIEEQMLSTQDLVDILKFAAQIYNTDPYGYFTPNLNNQNYLKIYKLYLNHLYILYFYNL